MNRLHALPRLAPAELAGFAAGHPGTVLLDVREPWERDAASPRLPPGVTLLALPMGELADRLAEVPRAQPVVCLCHHGVRSAQVVAFLQRAGHPAVYNLDGGVDAWSAELEPSLPRY